MITPQEEPSAPLHTIDPRSIFKEQVRLVQEYTNIALLVNLLVASIYLFLLWGRSSPLWVQAGWALLLLAAVLYRRRVASLCRRTGLSEDNASLWAHRFFVAVLFNGSVWGLGAVLLELCSTAEHHEFAIIITGGLAIGAITTSSAVLSIYWAFILPMTVPLAIRFFFKGETDYLLMGVSIALFVGVMLVISRRFNTYIRESIILRYENRQAIRELTDSHHSLQQSEQYLHLITASLAEGLFVLDRNGSVVFMNPEAERLLGWKLEELKDRKLHDLIHRHRDESSVDESQCAVFRALQERRSCHEEDDYFFCKDGHSFPVSFTASPMDAEDEQQSVVVVFQDISKRKQNERKLQASEQRFHDVAMSSADWIWEVDTEGQYTFVSGRVSSCLGYDPEELLGKTLFDLMPAGEAARVVKIFSDKIVQQAPLVDIENWNLAKSGQRVCLLTNGVPILDELGELRGYRGVDKDITDRKEAEKILHNQRLELQRVVTEQELILGNTVVGIALIKERQVIWCNQRLEVMLGYSHEGIVGNSTRKFYANRDDFHRIGRESPTILAEGKAYLSECLLERKDGSHFWCHFSGKAVNPADFSAGVIYVMEDVTTRKIAEDELRKLSQAIEQSPVTVVITDVEGTIQYVNPRFSEVTGYSATEAIGQNPRILSSGTQDQDFYKDLWQTITAGRVWQGDFCNMKKNGEIYWERASISPIRNERNDITHFVAVKEDITYRKQMEEELIQAKQDADTANRAKSEFLANMSHEIRTPMNAILGFSELLEDKIEDSMQHHYLSIIRSSGNALLSLISDTLDLSKIEAGRLELEYAITNPRSVVHEVEALFSHKLAEKNLPFMLDLDPSLPDALLLDEARLRQVLINLVGNALKFTESGSITLGCKACYLEGESHGELIFTVEDTGIGIAQDQLENIFAAFSQQAGQSHAQYGGTGLGLTISKRLVALMNGSIHVESVEGKGTRFQVTLCDVKRSGGVLLKTEEKCFSPDMICFKRAKILIVDDSLINRKLLKAFLERYHFQLFEATDGKEAVACARKHHPDLILMDLRMPVMDGNEAAEILKNDKSLVSVPIIAVTASTMKKDEEKMRSLCDGFIFKPVNGTILIKTLANFLDHTSIEIVQRAGTEQLDWKKEVALQWEDIDQHARARVPELVHRLEEEFRQPWDDALTTLNLDHIEKLAKQMCELGEEFNVPPLQEWGERIQQQVKMIDIDCLPITLGQFSQIISMLNELVISKEGGI